MGELFLGVQQGPEGFSKVVVVKRMVSHLTKNADFVEMFIDEARIAARLEHPNIVKTYEFGDHEGQYYTVMEFLAGEDLRRMLNKLRMPPHRRLSLPLAIHIVAQICNGLHFAHELTDPEGSPLDLVHRDVNPANVIVTYAGEVKIIDFGVAKVSTTTRKTLAGVIKGKVAYMSPEHILSRKVDRRSDVFSAGIILWEMLMGRPLFARDCDAATIYAVMNDPIPRPSVERPEIPPELDAIVARALARSPRERFATADDMRAALDGLAAKLPRCDGRTIGRMMEKVFGRTRAQAKRSIAQSRSLAYNVALVMKTTGSIPIVAPPALSSSTSALPIVALPAMAVPEARRRRWLVIDTAIASLCGLAAIFAVGAWIGTSSMPSALSPPRIEVPIAPATASGFAVSPPTVSPPAAPPPAGPRPMPSRPRSATGLPGQGALGAGSSAKSTPSPRDPALGHPLPPAPPAAADPMPEITTADSPVPATGKPPSLDITALRAAVRSQIGPLQQCYERARMDDANLRGSVTAQITVAGNGSVARVQVSHSTLNAPQALGCITREIARWHLPRPSGRGTVAFLYPFVFE